MSKITAKDYFANNALFEFVKFEDNKTSSLSVTGSTNKYVLKCKVCGEENNKNGNSKILLKCTQCGSELIPTDEDKNKSVKDYNLTNAALVIGKKSKKEVKSKVKVATAVKEEIEEVKEESEEEVKVENDQNFKFYDSKNVIRVKAGKTETVENQNVTTDDEKKNLIGHIYIPENKALAIGQYVFVREPFSIFNNFRSVTNLTENVIESNTLSLQPNEIAKINEKNVAPSDYFDLISKYFNHELENIDQKSLIFNSVIKWNWTLKSDENIVINCNPAKAYVLSLLLEDDDTINIETYAKYTMKKLTKGLELDADVNLQLNTKYEKDSKVEDIEYSYTIKKYIWFNKDTNSNVKKFLTFVDTKVINKSIFVFSKLEMQAFKMIMEID